jgi:hypothetical protein
LELLREIRLLPKGVEPWVRMLPRPENASQLPDLDG